MKLVQISGGLQKWSSKIIGWVTSRATLSHTGRPLHAPWGLTLAYILVSAAAALRIAATLSPEFGPALLVAAELSWIGAFILFLSVCGPMLIRPGR